ncbi:hypothetical protein CSOJ01_06813 [Colletotrichum sojae]|uniref:Uncharacterized protein n=1 Tax=Colletotrichum sojae TaxID=2175907 RepID=A0A8H6MVH2_9PEZI|nr:hypothetical protein CSOJ01_06813 [Colletotrichum sojae]
MKRTCYTADELLALRGTQQQLTWERKLLVGAKDNQVLVDIMRQKHPLRHRRGNPFLSRASMEARNSSSAESEVTVFVRPQITQSVPQAHEQPAPQSAVVPQAVLAPQTAFATQVAFAPQSAVGPQTAVAAVQFSEVHQLDGHGGRQLDGQDTEPEPQPTIPPAHRPAQPDQKPTLPEQKRKGFEQFYEAVRSPTHVRVTAGGRIVPNNLDTSHASSPTGKSGKERLTSDVNGIQVQPQPQPQPSFGTAFNGASFLPGHPMMGQMHPVLHPGFPIMAQGQPGTIPPFAGFPVPQFAMSQMPPQASFAHPVGIKSPNNGDEKTQQNDVASSFGGQWLFPPHPMMPMGMPFPGHPMMPVGFNPMAQPMVYQHPPTPVSAMDPKPVAPAAQPDNCPVSSIRPSIITKNQLAGLRSSLKKAEAQLAYNRHQIDEKHMEEYARQLRADIEHFEVKLKGELALEDGNVPARRFSSDGAEKHTADNIKPFKEMAIEIKPDRTVSLSVADEQKPLKSRKKDRVKLAVDTSKASASFSNMDMFAINSQSADTTSGGQLSKPNGVDHTRKPSVLPVTAALAPVFQPRSEPWLSGDDDRLLKKVTQNVPTGSKQAADGSGSRGHRSFSGRFHGPVPANLEESNRYLSKAPPTPAHDIEEFSNFARDNAGLGLPYLVGEVPFGMDPGPEIRDYIYHRALTQDEEMAKHLYWTHAPDHLRMKFPKFDGKDFYPASPEKQARPNSKVVSALPTGKPEKDYGFSLPTSDLDPFAPLEPYGGPATRAVSARQRDVKRDTKSDNVTSPMKYRNGNKPRPVAYFNSQGIDESKGSSGSSDNVCETDSERAYFNSCVRAWSERVTSNATALPGTVTSENARGYLPQYTIGHAAASLSPAIIKAAGQAARLTQLKAGEGAGPDTANGLRAVSTDGRAENQPPGRSIHIN